MMDTFDFHYAVEMKEFIFHEYNNNRLIIGHMYYVLDGDNKYNNILGRDFNT